MRRCVVSLYQRLREDAAVKFVWPMSRLPIDRARFGLKEFTSAPYGRRVAQQKIWFSIGFGCLMVPTFAIGAIVRGDELGGIIGTTLTLSLLVGCVWYLRLPVRPPE